ncbi:MAG: hypothetical protein M3155_09995 [Actinomycetota bacterium]|nr:hypothetical protein [Actinomycetota bacterium]
MRALLLLVAAAGALGLAGCGSSSKRATTTAAQPAGPAFLATLRAPGHNPRAGKPWPVVVTATTRDGKPLRAVVRYQFVFAGRVVAERSRYTFRGRFRDVVTWPARSVGIPLTFRAAISTRLGTRNLDYPVTARP